MTRSVHDALVVRLRRLGGVPLSPHTPVPSSGAYVILFDVPGDLRLRVGALGLRSLRAGLYAYVGRAARGLPKRIARHLRPRKHKRWHIDYLSSRREVQPVAALFFPERQVLECELAQALLRAPGAGAEVAGFGASDCRRGCPAHLIRIG